MTVNGSVNAEVHSWEVNLETREATIVSKKKRQVRAQDKRLDIGPLVTEILIAVTEHKDDPRLKWHENDQVRVLIAAVIPKTNKDTTSGRRRRFWMALEAELLKHRWQRASKAGLLTRQL